MKFIQTGSYWSQENGYFYYENGNVLEINQINEKEYSGKVKGSEDNVYFVHVYPDHPRKSTCDCPRAKGRRVVCKHLIAAYLTIRPQVADEIKRVEEERLEREQRWIEEYEKRQEKRKIEARKYANSLTVKEMREIIYRTKLSELEEIEEQYFDDEDEDEYFEFY